MNRTLVIYHADCADGFGAAFAAWEVLRERADYLPLSYSKAAGFIADYHTLVYQQHYSIIYVLDFSFSRSFMEVLRKNHTLVWLDHHKTAFEAWCPSPVLTPSSVYQEEDEETFILLDNSKSGALLSWEYFHPGDPSPQLIDHLDDYDRWQFKLEGTKELSRALWSHAPWSFEQWKSLMGRDPELIEEGKAILRAHDQNVQGALKETTIPCSILITNFNSPLYGRSFPGLMANCSRHLSSDAGHSLAKQSGTFGLLWCMDSGGKIQCSLRSEGDYDVSIIAKEFGGGGHKNAAGFQVDLTVLRSWMNEIL